VPAVPPAPPANPRPGPRVRSDRASRSGHEARDSAATAAATTNAVVAGSRTSAAPGPAALIQGVGIDDPRAANQHAQHLAWADEHVADDDGTQATGWAADAPPWAPSTLIRTDETHAGTVNVWSAPV